ncbi:hypothetical protein [uncultured Alistipes sp.]|uniref:hypothetical protein n=1 Tax=uncultured Alistipes sp. TaxID=538949 RepID=UPI00263AA864|nr:hypothetical protein [uncultured Alistipes sp.]
MLIRILSLALRSHKRIVVPQLGAFLVKEPGGAVLFSELVRRDDGLLRGLLVEAGLSELAAAGEIDRFVFEVRHALGQGACYAVPGLGVFRPGANGTIRFEHRPQAADEPAPTSGGKPQPSPAPARTARTEPPRPAAAEQSDEPHLSVSARMHPEKCVEGLNYGRPIKCAKNVTYVDRPVRRGVDRFVLAAVLALLIALGAIAYGYYHDVQERRAADEMIEALEQATQPAETAE